ncbi:hypothetical protein ASG63_20445 [Methylobacterium sp. Leaf94]|nr:hypothetical protein ASG63_20445 [Methylobacterium sp. Leaf94]
MMKGFPHRQTIIAERIPIRRVFSPFQKPDNTTGSKEDTRLLYAVNARPLGTGKRVSLTEPPLFPPVLFEPVKTKLRVVIEIIFGDKAIDKL